MNTVDRVRSNPIATPLQPLLVARGDNYAGRVTETVIGGIARAVVAVQKHLPKHEAATGVADGGGGANVTTGPVQQYLFGRGFPLVRTILKIPVTRFDTPEVQAERLRQAEVLHRQFAETGSLSSLGIQTPERQQLRDHIVDALYAHGAPRQDREAWIIVSMPAGGKSTISDPLARDKGALVIDPEGPLDYLPEYQQTHCSLYTDAERRQIDDRVVQRALDHHDNIIVHSTSGEGAENTFKALKRYDYKVHVIYLELPVDKVVARARNRWHETGRFSDPLVDEMSEAGCKWAYDTLRPQADSYAKYSTDVARGEAPLLLEKG